MGHYMELDGSNLARSAAEASLSGEICQWRLSGLVSFQIASLVQLAMRKVVVCISMPTWGLGLMMSMRRAGTWVSLVIMTQGVVDSDGWTAVASAVSRLPLLLELVT